MDLQIRRRLMAMTLVGASLAALTIPNNAAQAQRAARTDFNIPAQDAAGGLEAFGRQSGRSVLFDPARVVGARTAAVRGSFTAEDGLRRLLAGTGFTFRAANANTFVVEVGGAARGEGQAVDAAADSEGVEDQEIVVTGTNIRGAAPVGSALRVYGREDFARAGAATIQDFARTIPENFSSVDFISNADSNIGLARLSGASAGNISAGSSFNIHGVGATGTLTLLNGRRLAPAGLDGNIVDMSLIPLAAVQRIDVLPDGSSAIYGADAVGGVVNIVTRRNYDGAETSLRYGGATAGGAEEFTGSQLVGRSWRSGNAFLAYQYRTQDDLDASRRDYVEDQGGPYSLLPHTRQHSLLLAVRQELGGRTSLSGEGLFSQRNFDRSVTSRNDFQNLLATSHGRAQQLQGAAALDHDLARDWHLRLDGGYSRTRQRFTGTTGTIGGPDAPSQNDIDVRAQIWSIGLLAEGSLFALPTGDSVKLAAGGTFRRESFVSIVDVGGFVTALPRQRRSVRSIFGELNVPIGRSAEDAPVLELSAAVRHDDYSDFGATTNYKLGASVRPVAGLVLRANFGTSFRAPTLSQIGTPRQYVATLYPDSAAAGGLTQTIIVFGGNPDLEPERSRSFTAGFDLRPPLLPGLSVSFTYYNVHFRNQVATPPLGGVVDLEDAITRLFVTRDPALSAAQAIYADPNFLGDFSGTGLGAAGVDAILDTSFGNISAVRVEGLDMNVAYSIPLRTGSFRIAVSANRTLANSYRPTSISDPISLLNGFGQTPKFRGRADLGWTNGGLATNLAVNYLNAYRNTLFDPAPRIRAQATADLNLAYEFSGNDSAAALRGLVLSLSIINLTDRRPPFVAIPVPSGGRQIPFDPANASPLGRVITFGLTKRW